MSKIEVKELTALSGESAITLGETGKKIDVPSGATLDINSGATIINNGTATGFGGGEGSIIQVKSYSAEISFSGTGDSSLSVSITPSNTSSKIFITATLAHTTSSSGSDGAAAYFGFKRDSTDLGWYAYKNKDGGREGGQSLSFLDSPSSTSALTYLVHGSIAAITNEANSTITVMEVSGE